MSIGKTGDNKFGASEIMGPLLRKFVEQQLIEDIRNYKVLDDDLKFDWSKSCGEGHSIDYLDGILENFSYVTILDAKNDLVAEGWTDFIDNYFDLDSAKKVIVFWDYIAVFNGSDKIIDKTSPGIPDHIWERLEEKYKSIYKANKQSKRTIGLP